MDFTEEMEVLDTNSKFPFLTFTITYFGLECLTELNGNIIDVENVLSKAGDYTQYTLRVSRKDGFT